MSVAFRVGACCNGQRSNCRADARRDVFQIALFRTIWCPSQRGRFLWQGEQMSVLPCCQFDLDLDVEQQTAFVGHVVPYAEILSVQFDLSVHRCQTVVD